MGTQQILMIVLSVIVVGAAVAVGIQMFDTQATNSQRQAMSADLQNFGAQVLAYMRTPASMGGGQNATASKTNLADYLGFKETGEKLTNANGTYQLATFTYTAAQGQTPASGVATITAVSTDTKTTLTATINYLETDPTKAIVITKS
jgi:hypothetical protein